ncbi:hypothetical protein BMS3Bbin04_00465 [bacterium BMS3Bbin04]|nr:hypothetical protein BMS3Bbin04_00465 [bacterium BMS3Bbin04]
MQFIKRSGHEINAGICDYCCGFAKRGDLWMLEPWGVMLHRFCARRFVEQLHWCDLDALELTEVIERRFMREPIYLDSCIPSPVERIELVDWQGPVSDQ